MKRILLSLFLPSLPNDRITAVKDLINENYIQQPNESNLFSERYQ